MVARRTAVIWALVAILLTALVTWGATVWLDGFTGAPHGTVAHPALPSDQQGLLQGLGLIAEHFLHKPDMATVTAAALRGAVASLHDPYSGYMTPAQYRAMRAAAAGRYGGVGIEVAKGPEGVVITHVVADSPAENTPYVGAPPGAALGLAAGDRVLAVNGQAVSGMDLVALRDAVQGAPGTLVQLEVERGGANLTFVLRRQEIATVSVTSRMLGSGVGYLRILNFTQGTPAQFNAQLAQLRVKGMRSLVLDLRGNPGGLLGSVLAVSRSVLPRGVVTYLQPRTGPRRAYRLSHTHPLRVPFVVLVNGHTASAAELLAGAIQDDQLAPLVGQRTYGKGVVQQIFPLADGGALRLTVAQYLTPNGRDINGVGIDPNETVAATVPGPDLGNPAKDPQLAAALRLLRQRAA